MGGGVILPPPEVDMSDNFVAIWESVDLSATLCNTQENLEESTQSVSLALSITGVVDAIDSQNVIGISTDNMRIVSALNADQAEVQCIRPLIGLNLPTYQKFAGPTPFTVRLDLDQNEAWPLSLSTVACEIVTLYAKGYQYFDIPFAPSYQWVVLKPGIMVRVEQARCDGMKYDYILQVRYEGTDPTALQTSRYTSHLPDDMVMQIQVLDAQEAPVPVVGTGSLRIGNTNIRTGKGPAAHVKTLRFKLATDPHKEEITLWLTDIPVPVL